MLDLQTIVLFSTASLALCATPGPDMIVVAARSAAQGRMAGLVTHLGVATGSAFHAFALAFTARSSFSVNSPSRKQKSLYVIFKQGLISNISNPKVVLFYLALFPQFLDPAHGSVAVQIIALAIILQVIGLGLHGVVIWLAGSMSLLPSNGRVFAKWSRYFLGAVFGGLAARLIFDGQR